MEKPGIFFFFFVQNIDCVYTVLTSTHNLCFGTKIRKNRHILANPSFYCIKVGFKGVYFSWTCFPDVFLVVALERRKKYVGNTRVQCLNDTILFIKYVI